MTIVVTYDVPESCEDSAMQAIEDGDYSWIMEIVSAGMIRGVERKV